MRKKEAEANLFRYFLELNPLFADERISDWSQPNDDLPDVLCITESGRTVGVELGSWLDRNQMNVRKQRERIEADILAAIGDQPTTPPSHLRFVWLHPRNSVRMNVVRASDFRSELLDLIERANESFATDRVRRGSEIFEPSSSEHPRLARALHSIQCFPRRDSESVEGFPWIGFRSWGGPYSPRSMVVALRDRVSQKREKYRLNSYCRSLSEFVLVVHYDQALLYNGPVEAPNFKFDDAMAEAREFLASDPGAFSRVFVLIALEPSGRVFQLYPSRAANLG